MPRRAAAPPSGKRSSAAEEEGTGRWIWWAPRVEAATVYSTSLGFAWAAPRSSMTACGWDSGTRAYRSHNEVDPIYRAIAQKWVKGTGKEGTRPPPHLHLLLRSARCSRPRRAQLLDRPGRNTQTWSHDAVLRGASGDVKRLAGIVRPSPLPRVGSSLSPGALERLRLALNRRGRARHRPATGTSDLPRRVKTGTAHNPHVNDQAGSSLRPGEKPEWCRRDHGVRRSRDDGGALRPDAPRYILGPAGGNVKVKVLPGRTISPPGTRPTSGRLRSRLGRWRSVGRQRAPCRERP